MRKVWTFFIVVFLLLVCVFASTATNPRTELELQTINQQQNTVPNPPGTIDGAVNPELIPDAIAYSMLFRLISDRQTEAERKSIQSYLAQAGILVSSDRDSLIAVAEEYKQRVDASGPQNSENIASQLITTLPTRVSPVALASIRAHIANHVKRKIKIIPGPQMPANTTSH